MKSYIILFLLILSSFFSCKSDHENFEYAILELVIQRSNGKAVQFNDLYSSYISHDSLYSAHFIEKPKLVEILNKKGFKIVDNGRGNFPPLGPRIISYTLIRDNCQCEVSKIYYYTITKDLYSISESIDCNKLNLIQN